MQGDGPGVMDKEIMALRRDGVSTKNGSMVSKSAAGGALDTSANYAGDNEPCATAGSVDELNSLSAQEKALIVYF